MLFLAFLGGILTILSPCVLPVIPLVLSRAGRPFAREVLPMLVGLALAFATVASVATVSASWIVRANEIGRVAALVLLGVVGATLLFPRLAEALARPLVELGQRMDASALHGAPGWARNATLGAAMGLLWAPCAGPILGLVIAGAALEGVAPHTLVLFVAFAAGAATSLAFVMLLGARAMRVLKRYAAADVWVRRALGASVLATLLLVATGADSKLFAKASGASAGRAEHVLIDRLHVVKPAANPALDIGESLDAVATRKAMALPDEGAFPGFDGATTWINSSPLTPDQLKGKVVLIDFWTFECYNCLNALPHVQALDAKYRDQGLVVIGVHTPELPRERDEANVREAVKRLGVTYPVVMDNDYAIWNRFNNQYWPAAYYIDHAGKIRFHQFGEGRYDEQEQVVQQLLREAHEAQDKSRTS